ncbi:MAG: hypothetical protein AB7D06_02380 [Pedobacter sp.]
MLAEIKKTKEPPLFSGEALFCARVIGSTFYGLLSFIAAGNESIAPLW